MRALGVDLGERRIGIAVSDSSGVLATPRTTIERTGSESAVLEALESIVLEAEARVVVVGLPLSLDGSLGPAARRASVEIEALQVALEPLGVKVEAFDERFTSTTAHRALSESGRSARARRKVVDETAATVLLQAWLDARRGSPPR